MSDSLDSDDYKKRVSEEEARLLKEYEAIESASWFGKTGLDEDTERELPHYIRREYGESVYDEDGLQASDLEYLGLFETDEGSIYFWKIPTSTGNVYAYAAPFKDGYCLGFGDKTPPGYP